CIYGLNEPVVTHHFHFKLTWAPRHEAKSDEAFVWAPSMANIEECLGACSDADILVQVDSSTSMIVGAVNNEIGIRIEWTPGEDAHVAFCARVFLASYIFKFRQ